MDLIAPIQFDLTYEHLLMELYKNKEKKEKNYAKIKIEEKEDDIILDYKDVLYEKYKKILYFLTNIYKTGRLKLTPAKKSGLPFLTSRCENNTRSNRSKHCESIFKIIWATLRCHGAHCAVSVYPVLWPARDTPICISDR